MCGLPSAYRYERMPGRNCGGPLFPMRRLLAWMETGRWRRWGGGAWRAHGAGTDAIATGFGAELRGGLIPKRDERELACQSIIIAGDFSPPALPARHIVRTGKHRVTDILSRNAEMRSKGPLGHKPPWNKSSKRRV